MASDDSGRKFYLVAIAFALGIFVRSFIPFGLAEITLVVLIAFVLAVLGRRPAGGRAATLLISLSLASLFFSLGALRMEWASWHESDPFLESQLEESVTLSGIVAREPEQRANSIHLFVKTEYGLVLVTTPPGKDWRYGDEVLVKGKIKVPEAFVTDLGRSFNYPGYLLAQGVSYTISFTQVEKVSEGGGAKIFARIFEFKQAFMRQVELVLPEPHAGLGEGLLLGVKRALGDDLEDTFRQTGIIHIVVLSGYNVMLVVFFILYILGYLFNKRLASVFGIGAVVIFAVMVGLGATVIRASIMAVLLLLLGFTGRVYLVLRGLCIAGVLMLLWNPYALAFDVGFQLSFLATLGLIFFSPYLEQKLTYVPTIVGVRGFLVATLATQLFVLPLLLYQMGQFSVVAVLVNVLVLPMVPVAMLLTFITGMVGFISLSLATKLAYLPYLSLAYIINLAEWFGNLPFAYFTVPAFPFWLVPVAYFFIILLLWYLNQEPDELSGWEIEEV